MLEPLPPSHLCAADTAYDSDTLRDFLKVRGTEPVIPNNPTRKRIRPFDPIAYRRRNIIERTFCRLKDWRRVATRY
ncbi:transposase [Rhizobium rhizogenes]|uniref:transposase n=1 Tax=Rhizobium rhizogenes TaxID=359 RepID=UPI0015D49511